MLDAMLNSMSPVFTFDGLSGDHFSLDALQAQNTQEHEHPFLSDHLLDSVSSLPMRGNETRSQSQGANYASSYPSTSQHALGVPSWGPPSSLNPAIPTDPNQSSVSQRQPSPWTHWSEGLPSTLQGSLAPSVTGPRAHRLETNGAASALHEGETGIWQDGIANASGSTGNGVNARKAAGRMKTGADVYHSVVKPL
jgi:hypothetical protein